MITYRSRPASSSSAHTRNHTINDLARFLPDHLVGRILRALQSSMPEYQHLSKDDFKKLNLDIVCSKNIPQIQRITGLGQTTKGYSCLVDALERLGRRLGEMT